MEPTENMSFYRNKKVLTTKGISKHLNEYDIVSDNVEGDGIRTIVIKPSDKTEHLRLCKELATKMVEKMGEGDNRLLNNMLFDTLRDYRDKEVIEMHKKVVLGKETVKHKEGCFKIIIGDGRKKNHHEIMLID
jgi:hypothetical protein